MATALISLYNELKEIRVYLIKIGPSRRKGNILEIKLKEANNLYERYNICITRIDKDIKAGRIDKSDFKTITNICDNFIELYYKILDLCKIEQGTDINMASFDLKTALSLLQTMTGEESDTKQLIDNIIYYDSTLTSIDCKQKLINFVVKSRLSQAAKLKLKLSYTSVKDLVADMRTELLPKKAATAIQSRLLRMKQNELSVANYGKELTELFVDLTISQANGDENSFKILKPINEKVAIKQFADGLRNRRLSTIISARNYDSLKDAVQAAQDEEVSMTSTSGEMMSMNRNKTYDSSYRGRRSYYRGSRRPFHPVPSYYVQRGQGHGYGNQQRGRSAARGQSQQKRGFRGTYYNNRRSNQGIRGPHNLHFMTESENENNTDETPPQNNYQNQFFRE